MLYRTLIPIVLLAFSLSPASAAQELKVGAQVDKTEVSKGEVLTFSVTISGPIQETPRVELTSFEGLQVVSTGQSQQIQVKRGETRLTLTLSYSLAPTTLGTHTLGPVKVEYRGHVYQTSPIEVKVVPPPKEGGPVPGPQKKGPAPREERETPDVLQLEGGVIL